MTGKIRIVSSGKTGAARAYTESGEELTNITHLVITFDAKNFFTPIATVTFLNPDIDIIANIEEPEKTEHGEAARKP